MKRGFTLIEILVVIAIIAILSVTVFVALNPVQRFQDSRNARRVQDVNSVLTAVHEYIVDNDGSLPTGLTTSMAQTELGTCTAGNAACAGVTDCVDLSTPLGTYLASMPIDPQNGSATTTGYTVSVTANNAVTVTACYAEGTTISSTR